jgi:hypothetical protein
MNRVHTREQISADWIVSHDPATLGRLPVRKESVLDTFASFQNGRAIAAARAIPDRQGFLDSIAVDALLLTVHWEMQRLAEEFFHGQRVSELLGTVISALRAQGFQGPLHVVDVEDTGKRRTPDVEGDNRATAARRVNSLLTQAAAARW